MSARPPAIVLGGSHGALSVVRSLGRRGIAVHAVNHADSPVLASRHARPEPILEGVPFGDGALERLRGLARGGLSGAVLLAASDDALELLLDHRDELARAFRLDLCAPDAQRAMLDKRLTYEAARAAGVPCPGFWVVESRADLARVAGELTFPLLVKPRLSHLFQRRFRAKFLVAHSVDEVEPALSVAEEAGVATVLTERIPGGDERLCSYYTYLDERGEALFDFTKRIVRRHPPGMGLACHHVSDHVEGIREPALRLFGHVGLRGVANVEFKRDPRDGVLKLIECNARFTAANALVARAGIDLASFVYNRLVGLPLPPTDRFRDGVRLLAPGRDFASFLALRRSGALSLGGWLQSVLRPALLPLFAWDDPRPSVDDAVRRLRKRAA